MKLINNTVKNVEIEVSDRDLADAFVKSGGKCLENYLGGQPLIAALATFIRTRYNGHFDTDAFPFVVGRVSQLLSKMGIVRSATKQKEAETWK